MAPTELCLRWITSRPMLQNAYQCQRPLLTTRVYGIKLYSKASKKNSVLSKQIPTAPKHQLSIPNYNPSLLKSPSVTPTTPRLSPKSDSGFSKRQPLVQRKLRDPSLESNIESKSAEPKKITVFAPRLRIALGVVLVGTILYSMVDLKIFSLRLLADSHVC